MSSVTVYSSMGGLKMRSLSIHFKCSEWKGVQSAKNIRLIRPCVNIVRPCAFSGFRISALRASTWTWIIFWNFHTALLGSCARSFIFVSRRCQTERQTEGFPGFRKTIRSRDDDDGHGQGDGSNRRSIVRQTSLRKEYSSVFWTLHLDSIWNTTEVQVERSPKHDGVPVMFHKDSTQFKKKENEKKKTLGELLDPSNNFHQKIITKGKKTKHTHTKVMDIKHFSDWIRFSSPHKKIHAPKSALPF